MSPFEPAHPRWVAYLLVPAIFIAMFAWLAVGSIARGPYSYDEADYMYAASFGFAANYTDSPAISIADFVRLGLDRGRDPSQRRGLSEYIRGARDIRFYRHWHGPLYYYWLVLLSTLELDEQTMRAWSLGFAGASFLVIYFGALWLFPGVQGIMAGALSGALFLWSYATVKTTELAPHQLFVLSYLASLVLLAKAVATGRRGLWYGSVLAAALAFCTLEVAFVLVATLALFGWVARARLQTDWKLARNSVLLFAAAVLAVWPGAILKLSFLQAYMFMAYLAVFRKNPWGDAGFAETWWTRFTTSPVEWILIAIACVLVLRQRPLAAWRPALPFLVYGGLMTLVLVRVNAPGPRYMLPFLPALEVFAGFTLAAFLERMRARSAYAIAAGAAGMIALVTALQIQAHPAGANTRSAELIATLREQRMDGKSLLVPHEDIPVIQYYFQHTRLKGYIAEAEIPAALDGERFDAVLYGGYPVRIERIKPR